MLIFTLSHICKFVNRYDLFLSKSRRILGRVSHWMRAMRTSITIILWLLYKPYAFRNLRLQCYRLCSILIYASRTFRYLCLCPLMSLNDIWWCNCDIFLISLWIRVRAFDLLHDLNQILLWDVTRCTRAGVVIGFLIGHIEIRWGIQMNVYTVVI